MDKETGLPEGASTYSAGTNTDPWTEVRIEVPAERIDAAGDIAHMTVPYGIYLEGGTSRMPPQPYLFPALDAVTPGFLAAMEQVIDRSLQ